MIPPPTQNCIYPLEDRLGIEVGGDIGERVIDVFARQRFPFTGDFTDDQDVVLRRLQLPLPYQTGSNGSGLGHRRRRARDIRMRFRKRGSV